MTYKQRQLLTVVVAVFCWSACSSFTEGGAIPPDLASPSAYRTPSAARELAARALAEFQEASVYTVLYSGLITDELTAYTPPDIIVGDKRIELIDRRVSPEAVENDGNDFTYGPLQRARGYAINALEALRKYDSTESFQLQAEILAIQGYTLIYLADLYCSGVPLSQIEFERDFKYVPGSSTQDVYLRAIAAFDSSLKVPVRSEDSKISDLARVGKARALLALGQSKNAAQMVLDVDLSYEFSLPFRMENGGKITAPWSAAVSVADREGVNGFPYVSGGDVRTAVYTSEKLRGAYLPKKYQPLANGSSSLVVASGIEAYLIRAEAALDDGAPNTWLALLNDARASRNIAALTDPVDMEERYRVLANERAAWLFMTGHRQGDLRRTVRNRKVFQDEVYPTGAWQRTFDAYGAHTNFAIPQAEYRNPFYRGCLDRDA